MSTAIQGGVTASRRKLYVIFVLVIFEAAKVVKYLTLKKKKPVGIGNVGENTDFKVIALNELFGKWKVKIF